VLDADAINILSENPDWLTLLPPQSILTPHVKEFVRLFGEGLNDFEKLEMALQKAMAYQIIIVLKGHRTFIASPSGKGYFNSTGNAGMATGGSGDVLTGIITGILAQGYPPDHAAILGVYLHGKAGDKAAARYGMDAMLAGDIIGGLGFE
ncbi:MAG TPA: NAD(P)H-hydrate dehydratase, partial [Niabella sp.]|nr:NAD(P)H-hydrate dehydratase [Niabella sp.]